MAKYLVKASYTSAGAQGVMKDGGSKRRAVAAAAIEKVGGKLESFYFAFGETDVFAIADFPNPVSAAAVSMAIAVAGGVNLSLTPLLTPEEIDQAAKMHLTYQAPGAQS